MKRLILSLVLVSLACQSSGLSPTPFAQAEPTNFSSTITPPADPSPTSTFTPPTPTAIASPTSGPYEQYTIDYLRERTYGSGNIEVMETIEESDSFTRYLIRYPSDGLNIYGFVNVPKGEGSFPVIIAIHGLVNTDTYQTLDYTTPAIDVITQAGYTVFHPNLRGYPPSDSGDNLFRVGMTIDVLNLIALVKSGSGPTEVLATAATDRIGLWGHSMGGNIVLRVLTVSSDIEAAVLYAPLSGEELKNAELLANATSDPSFQMEQAILPGISKRISPLYYYSDITSPIQLHHGTADAVIPVDWSKDTCNAATAAGIQIECIYYPEGRHTFNDRIIEQFYSAMLRFYQAYLPP
jgi:dipeptidyl aminopeptidase/acylaminoacyl peptidase